MFGYEKGAFTGADTRKLGLFEVANHGTLFLDEIGEMPKSAQVKLLRVLQDGEIEKIGRTASKIKVDARIIAATNKNIEEEIKAKRFREDLYYRLNVVPIYIPPLRERTEDIPPLFDYYLKQFSADMGKLKPTIDTEAMSVLLSHQWQGNVRELKNVIHRLLFIGEQQITRSVITTALGALLQPSLDPIGQLQSPKDIIPWREMERKMREMYFRFVRKNSTTDADAAKKLGLAPSNYHRMVKELGIKGQ